MTNNDMERTSSDISNNIDELQKQLKDIIHNRGVIQNKVNELQKDKLKLMLKIKDYQTALDKAKVVQRETEVEIKLEQSLFWKVKESGI